KTVRHHQSRWHSVCVRTRPRRRRAVCGNDPVNAPRPPRDQTDSIIQVAIPVALTDRPSAAFSLEVQLNADDYRRYFAIAGKRESGFSNATIFVIALFLAIAVAFVFRTLASLETQYPAAIELVGRYSLFAYLVGVLVFLLVGSIMRRRSI